MITRKVNVRVSTESTAAPSWRPEGLVYQNSYCELWYTGGKFGCYYFCGGGDLLGKYLYTSKAGKAITLAKGLALAKALELYDQDEVAKLFGPIKPCGFVTSYFSTAAKKMNRLVDNEKSLINWSIAYNEQILGQP